MKVFVTLDYVDGSKSKAKGPLPIDEVDMTWIRVTLMDRDVASFTITRADLLKRLASLEEPKP